MITSYLAAGGLVKRAKTTLDASGQNGKRALSPCLWNSEMTAAIQQVLAHTEVVLRNAMDRELLEWNRNQPGGAASWLLEQPEAPLRSMWDEALHKAFHHQVGDPGHLTYMRVVNIHQLRNRVSHMEPVLAVDFQARMKDIAALVSSIDPDVSQWITGQSRVSEVSKRRPQ